MNFAKTCCSGLAAWGVCRSARWYLDRSNRRDSTYLGGCVRLKTLWNRGAAFSLPLKAQWLPGLSAAALAAILPRYRRHPWAVGLILGGGASNLQERLTEGRVYDYLCFPKAPGPLKCYVYNLADLAVFLGAAALLLQEKPKR